ncbi:MAG: S1 RNA-binding domain-containing protein [Polyangiaceae bacterium]
MSDEHESFASLFAAQSKDQTRVRAVRVGDAVEGLVVHVGEDTIFVELDGKRQAMLDTIEMRAEDGTVSVKVGDMVRAKVVAVDNKNGDVRLGRSFGKGGDLAQLQQALEAGIAVEGKVTGVNKGGIEVDLGKGARGFCPMSQLGTRGANVDAKTLVGQVMSFAVVEIKDRGSVVLSRRRLIEAEGREARERVLSSLEKGKVVRGTVTSVREFGAFVDLGGLEGLVPASELGHDRGVAVADRVKAGEELEVQVLDIKDDEKGQKRITLSLKALIPAPERPATQKRAPGKALAIGTIVKGKVTRIEAYGVFVQVEGTEGREGRGLIPAAELGVPRGVDLRKSFPEGTELTAKVLETGDGRLKLSVKAAKDAAERADFEEHQGKAVAGRSMGTFADLFAKSKKK